jgi:hypothetical protein
MRRAMAVVHITNVVPVTSSFASVIWKVYKSRIPLVAASPYHSVAVSRIAKAEFSTIAHLEDVVSLPGTMR